MDAGGRLMSDWRKDEKSRAAAVDKIRQQVEARENDRRQSEREALRRRADMRRRTAEINRKK
jgi:hypothetical protein